MNNLRSDPQTILGTSAALFTTALTGAAFWLSYEHLHDLANGHGLNGARAWAWPSTVDMFIVIGELLVLRGSLAKRADWFAILLTAAGSLGSIVLNVAGTGAHAPVLDYVVSAVPPVAALLAFAALMRQIHARLVRISTPVTDAPSDAVTEAVEDAVDAPVYAALTGADDALLTPVDTEPSTAPALAVDAPVTPAADDPSPAPVEPAVALAVTRPTPVITLSVEPALTGVEEQPPTHADAPITHALNEPVDDPSDDDTDAEPTPYPDARHAVLRDLYSDGYRPGTKAMRQALIDAGYGELADGTIRGLRLSLEQHEKHLKDYPPAPRLEGASR